MCNKEFEGRADAKFCSPNCRVKASRNKGTKNSTPTREVNNLNDLLAAKGLPPIVKGSEVPPVEFVSSGIKEIDQMTGGFPRSRVTEIFGMKGVGKTSLMTRILQDGVKTLYIDTENAVVGIPDSIEVVREYMLEDVADIVEVALQTNAYDLIVIDSVASMVPRAETEGEMGDAHMGLKARLMGQWMRKINTPLSKSKSAVVFINQQRESLNPYGPQKFTPGGHALPYTASLRLELKTTKADRIIKDKETIGHWVNVEIEKSRICRPYQKARFKLTYA